MVGKKQHHRMKNKPQNSIFAKPKNKELTITTAI